MAKTKEELDAIKKEVETLTTKLSDLSQEELQEVVGGSVYAFEDKDENKQMEINIYTNKVEDKDYFIGK